MLFTADQLVAHAVGDYLFQSHWMADQKTTRWLPAVVHGLCYTVPFLLLTQSWPALAVIAGTHIVTATGSLDGSAGPRTRQGCALLRPRRAIPQKRPHGSRCGS
jgi:hypothetical protein